MEQKHTDMAAGGPNNANSPFWTEVSDPQIIHSEQQ